MPTARKPPRKPPAQPHALNPDDPRKREAPIRGRGSASRPASRFDTQLRVGEDDGWGSVYGSDELDAPAAIATTVTEERARTIISHNQSPDVGFSQSINPYRGCEHGLTAY